MKENTPRTSALQISDLLALPKTLTTDDGRRLRIQSWAPVYQHGKLITVTVVALVEKSDD
jgi:hypothetical protein